MTHNPDQLITRVLTGLRDTEAPLGLESRIAARIAARQSQAAEARTATASPFAATRALRLPTTNALLALFTGPRLYATAATILLAITFIVLNLHRQTQTAATVATTHVPQGFSLGSHSAAKEDGASAPAQPEKPYIANTQVPQGFSLGSHGSSKGGGVLTPPTDDPDTLALAETLAPSRPAPPMPLTSQEQLLLAATRQGQPLEMAELDTLRQPALRSIAEARERSTIRRYVESLLGPLAAAEAINPTPSSPTPDDGPIASASEPPSSK